MHRVVVALASLLLTLSVPVGHASDPQTRACNVGDTGYCATLELQGLTMECTQDLAARTYTCTSSANATLTATGPLGLPGKAQIVADYYHSACTDDNATTCAHSQGDDFAVCGWTDEGGCTAQVPFHITTELPLLDDNCPARYVSFFTDGRVTTPLVNAPIVSPRGIFVDSFNAPCYPDEEW